MKLEFGKRMEDENFRAFFGAAIIMVLGMFASNYIGSAFLISMVLAGLWCGYYFLYLPYQRDGGNAITDFFKKSRDQVIHIKGKDLKVGTKVQRAYRITPLPLSQRGIDFIGIFKALRVIDITMTFSEIWTEEPYHRLKRVLREVLKTAGLEHRRFIVDYLKSIEDFKKSPMNIILISGTSADVQSAVLRLKGFVRIEQILWKPPVNIKFKEGKNTLQIRDGPYPSAGSGFFRVLIAQELPGGSLGELIKYMKSARVNFYITPDIFRTDVALTVLDDDRKSRKIKKGKKRSEQSANIADYKQQIIDSLEQGVSAGLILIGTSVKVVVNAGDYDSLNLAVRNLTEWAQIAGFNLVAPENQATALSNVSSLTPGTLEKESIFTLPIDKVEEALSSMYVNADGEFLHGYPFAHDLAGFAVYLSKMGRCLIAGESGSGKSVGTAIMILNTILEKLKRVALIDHAGNGQTGNSIFLALKRAIEEGYLNKDELTVFDFSDNPEKTSRINLFRVFKDKDIQREFEIDVLNILSGGLSNGEKKKVLQLRKKCRTFSELVKESENMTGSDLGDRIGYWDTVPWLFGDDTGPSFEENQYVSYNLWEISSMRSKIALINILMLIEQLRSTSDPCELYLEEAQDVLAGDPSLGGPTIKDIVTRDFRGGRKFNVDFGLILQNPLELITRGLEDVLRNLNTAILYSNVDGKVLEMIDIKDNIDIGKEGKTGVALLWKKRVGSVLVHLGISPMVQKLVLGTLDGFQPPKMEETSNRFLRVADITSGRKADLLAQGHQITSSTELVGGEKLQFIHEPVANRERGVLLFLILEQVEKYLGENKYLYDIEVLPSGGWIKISMKGHHVIRIYVPEEIDMESIIGKIDSWNGRTIAVTREKDLEVPNAVLHSSMIAEALPRLLGNKNALQQ